MADSKVEGKQNLELGGVSKACFNHPVIRQKTDDTPP